MSRLTYKYENCDGYGTIELKKEKLPRDPLIDQLPYLDKAWEKQRNKLGQYEDIEEELGIDYSTLLKCLSKSTNIYIKEYDGSIYCCDGILYPNRFISKYQLFLSDIPELIDGHYIVLDLDKYNKDWSLNEESLQ